MITSNSMSLAIGITTNTLVHCFCEEFGNFQFDEQSNYYIPSAGNPKTVARYFYTLISCRKVNGYAPEYVRTTWNQIRTRL